MTNREFYAFCRDQRKIEFDPEKRAALTDVYNYMRECGVTKRGVAQYITTRINQINTSQENPQTLQIQITAYQWLTDMFTRSGAVQSILMPSLF